MKTEHNVNEEAANLLSSNKPVILMAKLQELPLTEETLGHFSNENNEYFWNSSQSKEYGDAYIGILNDPNLNYIHAVIASKEVYDYITKEIYKTHE